MAAPGDLPKPRSARLRLSLDANLKLLATAERLRGHWANAASGLGLSPAQAKVILALEVGEPVAMRPLARRLDYDASNLTNVVDRLEEKGLVERTSDPSDRRVRTLGLTEEGTAIRAEFWQRLTGTAGPLAPLDSGQLEVLDEILDVLLGEGGRPSSNE